MTEVSANVLAALLILDETRDNDTDPWTFEIITMDGNRRNIEVKPGMMIVYESAKLVHGFPIPYQGKK